MLLQCGDGEDDGQVFAQGGDIGPGEIGEEHGWRENPAPRARCESEEGAAPIVLPSGAMKLCIFVAVNVGGWAGWTLGENFGLMTAFLASGAGSVLGVYLGWRVARRLLS